MLSMVQDKKRAFYKMGCIMALEPIKQDNYEKFILGWFEKGGYSISFDCVRKIIRLGEGGDVQCSAALPYCLGGCHRIKSD